MTGFIGLLKIELPETTIRLCDGGYIYWGAELFRSKDALFGSVANARGLDEGIGDEVPALEFTFHPASTAAAADLSKPGHQTSRVSIWLAEYDPASNTLTAAPDLLFDGTLDQSTLSKTKDARELAVSVVSALERLFERNIGNGLNPAWHKSVWPGEAGHDNATGLSIPVAWGAETPPQSNRYAGSASPIPAAAASQSLWWSP